ncbi:ferric reductase NAD binding domain-containing protein [Xylariales sp. AK1849]|nr:ferric reductase NAD binding domain-containing protein [Xylariales sp. AK1849]
MDHRRSPTGGSPQGLSPGSPSGNHSGPSPNPAFFAARQQGNELATKYYAAALCGLMAIFIISHWVRKFASKSRISTVLTPLTNLSRAARRVFIRKIPGFTSAGHAILVSLFVAINLVLSFTGYDVSSPTNIAARFGWMAAANFSFVVFLGLKNTPLAILTSYSYERLNPLHQIAGYATIAYMIMHAAIFCAYFINKGSWGLLQEDFVTAGIVLGFAMLASGVEAVVLRRLQYELFYVFHIILFITMVVTLGLHRPELDAEKVGIVACFVAAIWGLDRLVRLFRLLYNSVNNQATIHPLPNGGTQILLRKPLPFSVPGTHCFVWLPRIRLFETHPFTIVATSPTELIVNTYSGFTKDLHRCATKNPGASLRVSLEGPYGTFPDPMDFDKVVLVAGGSGASFTFGIASNMLQRMTEKSNQQVDFIWAVRDRDNMSWFTDHLNAIRTHTHAPKVSLRLHTTKSSNTTHNISGMPKWQPLVQKRTAASQSSSDMAPTTPVSQTEKDEQLNQPDILPTFVAASQDPEKNDLRTVVCHMGPQTAMTGSIELPVEQGRPDIAALVQEAVRSVDKDKRVLIAACGPDSLMKVVRNTAAGLITKEGPSVELHCEQFGW